MSNLKLYHIEQDYIALAEQIIDNGGEVSDELNEALQINKEQLEHKGRGYGFIVKTLESEIDIIDSEIKRLSALKSSRNRTIDRLKESITNAMNLYEITEIKTPTLKINFRKSESVEVEELVIDEKWCKAKTTITPDKVLIKDALKKGETIVGAVLKNNLNLQIK